MCICVSAYGSEAQDWCAQTPWVCGGGGLCVFAFFGTVRVCLNIGAQGCVCSSKRERKREYVFPGVQARSTCV